jgi:hypothetical protein
MANRRVSVDPTEEMAKALLADIKQHLPEVVFFQREDLLHLPVFQYVATVTRYRYVCDAVNYLLSTNRLVALSRTDLALPGNKSRYREIHLEHDYDNTVAELILQYEGERIEIPRVLLAWRSDQHLTDNSKRIAIRGALRRMFENGTVSRAGYFYMKKGNARNAA